MSLSSLLKIEFMKQKRGFIWKVIFIVPLLSILLFSIILHFKYADLTSPRSLEQFKNFGVESQLGIFLFTNHLTSLWFMFSSVIFALTAVKINFTEHDENCWKLLLSMPVNKNKVYISKWLVIFTFSTFSIILNTIGFVIVLFIFKSGTFVNLTVILKYIVFQILCSLSIISFQQFISFYSKKLLVSLCIAFLGIINTIMFSQSKILSNIIPYTPTLRSVPLGNGSDAAIAVFASILSSLLWFTVGIIYFNKTDIK
ncbi:ABC transporter permease [Haloimpatiens sp. FM7330]|uniref:ABC transporter permease n=1 Tax=Haloimpatiens sp. FM7330 TaxID=3298610 RepID=UPI00363D283A